MSDKQSAHEGVGKGDGQNLPPRDPSLPVGLRPAPDLAHMWDTAWKGMTPKHGPFKDHQFLGHRR